MEFVVPCPIDISDFILIGISFVSILMISKKVIKRVKGHHLSVMTSLCLHFYWIKLTWAFKHQPVLQ